jgi:hypothetical protein
MPHELTVQFFQPLAAETGAHVADVALRLIFTSASTGTPKNGRDRLRAVNPAITTSWRLEVLIFSQSLVRSPDTYPLSTRLAMTPSRPSRSVSSKYVVPDVLRWRLNTMSL